MKSIFYISSAIFGAWFTVLFACAPFLGGWPIWYLIPAAICACLAYVGLKEIMS
jgi:hypothetical protein